MVESPRRSHRDREQQPQPGDGHAPGGRHAGEVGRPVLAGDVAAGGAAGHRPRRAVDAGRRVARRHHARGGPPVVGAVAHRVCRRHERVERRRRRGVQPRRLRPEGAGAARRRLRSRDSAADGGHAPGDRRPHGRVRGARSRGAAGGIGPAAGGIPHRVGHRRRRARTDGDGVVEVRRALDERRQAPAAGQHAARRAPAPRGPADRARRVRVGIRPNRSSSTSRPSTRSSPRAARRSIASSRTRASARSCGSTNAASSR